MKTNLVAQEEHHGVCEDKIGKRQGNKGHMWEWECVHYSEGNNGWTNLHISEYLQST
jgi:hypothetical protein